MNKAEFVGHLAHATSSTKREVEAMRNRTTDCFGSFSRTARAARVGRNPQTGEPIQIAASKGVKFSARAGFASAVS